MSLRGLRRTSGAGAADLVGFKNYFAVSPAQAAALDGHVEVILFAGGYAGLQMVEGRVANLCLLVRPRDVHRSGRMLGRAAGHLMAITPHLARRLDGAMSRLARPLSIYRVPYGFLHAATADERADVFRLGDQVGVIPSFSGDGIAIALHSAHAAAHDVPGWPACRVLPPPHATRPALSAGAGFPAVCIGAIPSWRCRTYRSGPGISRLAAGDRCADAGEEGESPDWGA